MPRTQFRLWPLAAPEGVQPVYIGSIVQIDAVTLRMSDRVPNWPTISGQPPTRRGT